MLFSLLCPFIWKEHRHQTIIWILVIVMVYQYEYYVKQIFGLIDITLCSIEYICLKRPLANAGLVIITNYYSISLPFTSLKLGMGFYSRICLQMLTSNAANYFCTRRNALLFSQACNYHAELKYEWDLQWIGHNVFHGHWWASYCLKCPSDCKTRPF